MMPQDKPHRSADRRDVETDEQRAQREGPNGQNKHVLLWGSLMVGKTRATL